MVGGQKVEGVKKGGSCMGEKPAFEAVKESGVG